MLSGIPVRLLLLWQTAGHKSDEYVSSALSKVTNMSVKYLHFSEYRVGDDDTSCSFTYHPVPSEDIDRSTIQ